MANETQAEQQPAKAKRAVIRIPAAAILAIGLLTFGMTPVAWTVPGMLVLYVIPAALLYWVLRVRTTATPDGLATRTLFGQRDLSWTEISGLSLTNRGRVFAVTIDDEQVALPAVRMHNLPALSLISGGRLPDPSGLTTELDPAAEQATDQSSSSGEDPAEQAETDPAEPPDADRSAEGDEDDHARRRGE